MNKNKLVIFDLDGTLLNTIEDITICLNKGLKDNNIPLYSVDEVKHMVGSGVDTLIKRAISKDINADFQKVKDAYMYYYGSGCKIKTSPYPKTLETLKALKNKGIKIAVLSNKPQRDTDATVDYYFPNIFDTVHGAREGVSIKPSPEGVLSIIEEMNVLKENTIYVGDSDIDVLTAMNAKLESIICLYGFRTKEELSIYDIENYANNMDEVRMLIFSRFNIKS